MFVTPNMVDDGHDTTIDFAGEWVDYWLLPLLNDTNFNDNRTLILLTFDETETYTVNNHIFALLLGGAIPESARGTVDSTYYTHYPPWRQTGPRRHEQDALESLLARCQRDGLQYKNLDISAADIPLTNLTGTTPGPLNAQYYVAFTAPNTSAVGAGGGSFFIASGLDTNLTAASARAPVNLTAQNKTVPWSGPRISPSSSSNSSSSGNKSGGRTGGYRRRYGARRASCWRCCASSLRMDSPRGNGVDWPVLYP